MAKALHYCPRKDKFRLKKYMKPDEIKYQLFTFYKILFKPFIQIETFITKKFFCLYNKII